MNHKTWTPIKQGTLDPTALASPLRARKPWRYDIGDVTGAPFESLAAVLGVVSACPGSEFRLMVADPEWMGEFFRWVQDVAHPRLFPSWYEGDQTLDANAVLQYVPGPHMDGWCKTCRDVCRVCGDWDAELWPLPNLTLAVNTPDQPTADRLVPILIRLPAARREVALDPLVGEVRLDNGDSSWLTCSGRQVNGDCCEAFHVGGDHYHGIDLIRVRGETGPNARPCHPDWVRSLRDQCEEAGVAFVFLGWGTWADVGDAVDRAERGVSRDNRERIVNLTGGHGFHGLAPRVMRAVGKHKSGRLLDWRTHDEEGR